MDTAVYEDPSDLTKGTDWIAQPKLEISGDTTVVSDARTTKPVHMSVPGLDKVDYSGRTTSARPSSAASAAAGPQRLHRLPHR
ncbi:hypothetical protein R1T08_00005, partial [Streptomyces sp. SBC-4]